MCYSLFARAIETQLGQLQRSDLRTKIFCHEVFTYMILCSKISRRGINCKNTKKCLIIYSCTNENMPPKY